MNKEHYKQEEKICIFDFPVKHDYFDESFYDQKQSHKWKNVHL